MIYRVMHAEKVSPTGFLLAILNPFLYSNLKFFLGRPASGVLGGTGLAI
jgi:hypothetical protein